MISDKARTNRKHTSTESYREGYDRIYGDRTTEDFRHRPAFEDNKKILYTHKNSVVYNHGAECKTVMLPNGFWQVLKGDLK